METKRRRAVVKRDLVSNFENFMMMVMMVVVISSIAYHLNRLLYPSRSPLPFGLPSLKYRHTVRAKGLLVE